MASPVFFCLPLAPFGCLGVMLSMVCCAFLIGVAIKVVAAVVLTKCFKALPPEHRKQDPSRVWLIVIPLFGTVWNFFVYPRLSESYQSYFATIRRSDVRDCGKDLAMGYCICEIGWYIPYLNVLAGIASLVLMVVYLVKANDLKAQVGFPADRLLPPPQQSPDADPQ